MLKQIEIWKEYPLDYGQSNSYRVEVSNYGRVKTFTKTRPEGNIISGSLQEGYPIVRFTLYKERPEKVTEQIEAFNVLIAFTEERVRELKKIKPQTVEIQTELEALRKQKAQTLEKRKKFIARTDKKRKIYTHFLIHRAVAELFLDKPEGAEIVIHRDFNKTNNSVDNLAWVTKEEAYARYADNPLYKVKGMRSKRKKKSGTSKLSVENILYIKERLKKGSTLRALATKFNVSDMQIHRIKTGENWSDVKTLSEIRKEKIKHKKWQAT